MLSAPSSLVPYRLSSLATWANRAAALSLLAASVTCGGGGATGSGGQGATGSTATGSATGSGGDATGSGGSTTSSTSTSTSGGGGGSSSCPAGVTCVTTFPFHDDRDTSVEGSQSIDSYSCKPT